MGSKIPPPSYHKVADVFMNDLKRYGPNVWHEFLEECGLGHISLARLEIVNSKKYLLAKIKYGF